VYVAVLAVLGFVPKIAIDQKLVPPIHEYTELLSWALSFGVVPLFSALGAFIFSRAFEMHNICSKLLQLRFVWDKYFIVEPLRARAGSEIPLNRQTVQEVMNDFYYGAVKEIDQHYVHLFWRYALPFWIIFEHALIVALSIAVLGFLKVPHVWKLVLYLVGVIAVCTLQFFTVISKKSTDQVRQISSEKIKAFFNRMRIVVKA
jgi:hypothetical protein